MSIQREVRGPVLLLLGIQLLTGLGAMGVLGRMTPEIGRILDDNVRSVEAVEEMLVVLADPAPDADDWAQFDISLEAAAQNVTEAEETPLIRRIQELREQLPAADPVATAEVVAALDSLADVNHRSMRIADDRAIRLGEAGAWAVGLLTFIAAALTVLMLRRLHHRVIFPLHELRLASRDQVGGDLFRRAQIAVIEEEVVEIASALNRLMDTIQQKALVPSRSVPPDALAPEWNRVVDAFDVPAWVIDETGAIQHGNLAGMDWVSSAHSEAWMKALHEWLQQAAKDLPLPEATSVHDILANRRLVLYRGPVSG